MYLCNLLVLSGMAEGYWNGDQRRPVGLKADKGLCTFSCFDTVGFEKGRVSADL